MSEDIELPRERSHGHEVMETIKITVTLDGDLAATIQNCLIDEIVNNRMNDLIFCGHTGPKVEALIKLIQSKINIEERVEE